MQRKIIDYGKGYIRTFDTWIIEYEAERLTARLVTKILESTGKRMAGNGRVVRVEQSLDGEKHRDMGEDRQIRGSPPVVGRTQWLRWKSTCRQCSLQGGAPTAQCLKR